MCTIWKTSQILTLMKVFVLWDRLKKILYGLKQAPRAWYSWLDQYLTNNGFTRGGVDSNLYVKVNDDDVLVALVYVDDIVFGYNDDALSQEISKLMQSECEMSILGELSYFLGLQFSLMKNVFFFCYKFSMPKKFLRNSIGNIVNLWKH